MQFKAKVGAIEKERLCVRVCVCVFMFVTKVHSFSFVLIFSCFDSFMHRLTEEKKAQVVALREANFSWRCLCQQLHIKRSTARSIWKKFQQYKSIKNRSCSGRTLKFSARDQRFLVRFVKLNRKLSLATLTKNLTLEEQPQCL